MAPAESNMMKLTEKVSTVLAAVAGSGFMDPVQTMSIYPRALESGLTDFESNCRDWGFTFGVAYGIARGEQPYESDHAVCERAMTAAREVFSRFSKADIFTEAAFLVDREARPDPRAAAAEAEAGEAADTAGDGTFVDAAA
jgi:hypothetical protein